VTLIHARGTTETGNLGTTVGPALAAALRQTMGANNVAVQGVNYPASVQGATSGAMDPRDAPGAKNMASLVQKALSSCSNTRIILSGYSQGAEQVHGALTNIGPTNSVAVRLSNLCN
jgi:cutinase